MAVAISDLLRTTSARWRWEQRKQIPKSERAFHDLRELRVDVAFPFLLELYHDYSKGSLAREELLSAVRLVEAYVFRRAICAIPTNSLNKSSRPSPGR